MVKLNVTQAAFSGFGVIGRNPVAVLVWALFVGLIGVLPMVGLMGGFVTSVVRIAMADQHGVEPTPEMIMPMLGALFALLPVMMLTGLIVRTVLAGAIFRAVLQPRDKGWFYLRLGARELWLALLFLVVGILAFFVCMIVMVMVVPMIMLGVASDDPMVRLGLMRLAMLPVYAVMIFLFIRFSMAFPMTFAESRFRLFESWALTRGNGWRLFLMLLLLTAIAVAVEMVIGVMVVVGVISVIGVGAMSGDWSEERITAFFNQDPSIWMSGVLPWVAGIVVVACIVGTVFTVIFTAPLAEAYRQLSAKVPPTDAEPASAALAA